MGRPLFILPVLAFFGAFASQAHSKDLCLEMETGGTFAGSQYVLTSVELGAGKFGPVNGYWAKYDGGPSVMRFVQFVPVDGQAIVSSSGKLILGLTVHEISVNSNGSTTPYDRLLPVNFACEPGPNGKIEVLDSCTGFEFGNNAAAHVMDCRTAQRIP